jgi:signal peptidase I
MRRWIACLLAAALGAGTALAVAQYVMITDVTDNSMLPTYEEGEHVFVRRSDQVKVGDVVLFPAEVYADTGEDGLMMKRIVATAGDLVMITAGALYVNNRQVEEPYVFSSLVGGEMEQVTVEEGCVFVLGDNRGASTDSRSQVVGQVSTSDIVGKVIFKW